MGITRKWEGNVVPKCLVLAMVAGLWGIGIVECPAWHVGEIIMLKSVEGVYKNGKIELLEPMTETGEARVVVTFLPETGAVALTERGIGEAQAA